MTDNKGETITRDAFANKPLLISVVPSLDTSVCSKQTVRFNQEAAGMGDKANFLTVSADLPFGQARWCGVNDVTNLHMLSDHRDMSFGAAYGTYVKEVRIESRAVFVVDANSKIRHTEYVPVAGNEPDYEAALAVLRQLVG